MIKLQPKTLERIRDHFREVGQPASVAFTRPVAQDDPFSGDHDARRRFEALFEVMYLMIAADGNVATEEREVLRGAVRGLTDGAVRTVHIDKLLGECDARKDEGVDKRLEALAPILKEDPALVEAAFSLAAAIAFADDEIQDEENELINQLAEVLELDGDRADELLNQLESESEEG
jgi:tellurite resistance protein